MSSNVKILSAGPDTYVLNVYSTNANCQPGKKQLDADLKAELEALKQQAQDDEEDIETRFLFDGVPLLMKTRGSEGFNWILTNSSVTLAVNRGSKMALLAQARLSSEYLWKYHHIGLGAITSHVHVLLTSIFGQYITLQPSALDLAVDVTGFDVNTIPNLRECFVTRAQLDDERPATQAEDDGFLDGPDSIKRRWRRITGLPFGARNGQVSALIYDKTHEIKYHSPQKAWFHDLWRAKKSDQGEPVWDGLSPVFRIEMRFKRQAMNEMMVKDLFHGIDSAYEIDRYIPGLWSYAVGHILGGDDGLPDGWLRYVIPSDQDTNRARWPVHPDWQVIQSAFTPDPLPPSPLELAEQEKEDLLQLVDIYLEAHPFQALSPAPSSSSYKRRKQPARPDPIQQPEENTDPLFDLRPYVRKRKREINQLKAVGAIVGWASTFEAWQPVPEDLGEDSAEPDISDTLHRLYNQAIPYMEERRKDFTKLVHKKRVIYSVEPKKESLEGDL